MKFLRLTNIKFRGQKQKWFLVGYEGSDEEINVHTPKAEFSDWKWIEVDELLQIVVCFKRDLYISVIKVFDKFLKKKN